jgi:hypothetical protein
MPQYVPSGLKIYSYDENSFVYADFVKPSCLTESVTIGEMKL